MTDDDKRKNIQDEVARAADALHNRLLGGLQRARELADYDAAVLFTEEDAHAEVKEARAFETAALEFLRNEGWLPR
jgi:hypothetical protein